MKPFFKKVWNSLEEYLVITTFTLVLFVVLLQIVTREVFRTPISWSEESARFLYLWMVFLGISMITKKRKNICIEIIQNLFKNKGRIVYDIIVSAITLIMSCYLFYYFIEYVEFSMGVRTTALQIQYGFVYLCAPIGMLLCIIRCVQLIVSDIKALIHGKCEVPSIGTDNNTHS